ncbi:MAG: hypothetical protein WDW36_007532 [Sanguina aurantia]
MDTINSINSVAATSLLLSIKHTTDDGELYASHGHARGGVGVLLATGTSRGSISRLPQAGALAKKQSQRMRGLQKLEASSDPNALSLCLEQAGQSRWDVMGLHQSAVTRSCRPTPVACLPSHSPAGPHAWQQGSLCHNHTFLLAHRSARTYDVPPASKWAAMPFYERDPRIIRRHMDVMAWVDQADAQGKMIDAEILRAHHSKLAVEQRETFRRQRAEQAARYSRSGVLPSRTYACGPMTAPGPQDGLSASRGSGTDDSTIPGSSRPATSNWGGTAGAPGGCKEGRPATFPGTGLRVGGHESGLTGMDGVAGGGSGLSYPDGKEDDATASKHLIPQPHQHSVPGAGNGGGTTGGASASPAWAEVYGALGSGAGRASAWGSIPSVSSGGGDPGGGWVCGQGSRGPIYAEEQDAVVSQAEAVRLAAAEVAGAKERAVIALEMQALDDFDMGMESAGRAKLVSNPGASISGIPSPSFSSISITMDPISPPAQHHTSTHQPPVTSRQLHQSWQPQSPTPSHPQLQQQQQQLQQQQRNPDNHGLPEDVNAGHAARERQWHVERLTMQRQLDALMSGAGRGEGERTGRPPLSRSKSDRHCIAGRANASLHAFGPPPESPGDAGDSSPPRSRHGPTPRTSAELSDTAEAAGDADALASLTQEHEQLQAEVETLRQVMRENVLVPRGHMARVMRQSLAGSLSNNGGSCTEGAPAAAAAAAAAAGFAGAAAEAAVAVAAAAAAEVTPTADSVGAAAATDVSTTAVPAVSAAAGAAAGMSAVCEPAAATPQLVCPPLLAVSGSSPSAISVQVVPSPSPSIAIPSRGPPPVTAPASPPGSGDSVKHLISSLIRSGSAMAELAGANASADPAGALRRGGSLAGTSPTCVLAGGRGGGGHSFTRSVSVGAPKAAPLAGTSHLQHSTSLQALSPTGGSHISANMVAALGSRLHVALAFPGEPQPDAVRPQEERRQSYAGTHLQQHHHHQHRKATSSSGASQEQRQTQQTQQQRHEQREGAAGGTAHAGSAGGVEPEFGKASWQTCHTAPASHDCSAPDSSWNSLSAASAADSVEQHPALGTVRAMVQVSQLIAERAALERELAMFKQQCVAVGKADYAVLRSVHSQNAFLEREVASLRSELDTSARRAEAQEEELRVICDESVIIPRTEYDELQAGLIQAQALSSRAEVTARYCQQVPREELRQLRQAQALCETLRAELACAVSGHGAGQQHSGEEERWRAAELKGLKVPEKHIPAHMPPSTPTEVPILVCTTPHSARPWPAFTHSPRSQKTPTHMPPSTLTDIAILVCTTPHSARPWPACRGESSRLQAELLASETARALSNSLCAGGPEGVPPTSLPAMASTLRVQAAGQLRGRLEGWEERERRGGRCGGGGAESGGCACKSLRGSDGRRGGVLVWGGGGGCACESLGGSEEDEGGFGVSGVWVADTGGYGAAVGVVDALALQLGTALDAGLQQQAALLQADIERSATAHAVTELRLELGALTADLVETKVLLASSRELEVMVRRDALHSKKRLLGLLTDDNYPAAVNNPLARASPAADSAPATEPHTTSAAGGGAF